jgi:hypothetical protein
MTTFTSVFGIPVEGDITSSHRTSVEQRPIEELQPLLLAVLNHPSVEALRWSQYTPYFMDGDTCEFGVNELRVKFVGVSSRSPEDEYLSEDEWTSYVSTANPSWTRPVPAGVQAIVGSKVYNFDTRETTHDGGGDPTFLAAWGALWGAWGAAFEHALLDAFGDHAEITVNKDKIIVESYDHD